MNKKILIVDDDVRLRELLQRYLTEHNYNVLAVASAESMFKSLDAADIDLIVLDVMMPRQSGLEALKILRQSSSIKACVPVKYVPVILLTALDEEDERIMGLELGADDYLPKPFNPRELLARIQAVLRRTPDKEEPGAPDFTAERIHFADFTLDLGKRTLSKGETLLEMTAGEFGVLKILAREPRKTFSREKLLELSRGREYTQFDRSLDVQISRLRRLVEIDPAKPKLIQTVWGVGYVFVPE